ncbi:MAG: NADH:ubiquinone reductase (Na(+)-transporting) subunit B [Flavobacteriales bacterium]|nr:NADH:ubiquinone reductase (Na(+)-transporting) subunit B [Flavobacteriales bacterium]
MKALRKLIDNNIRPHFEEGGKLKRFWVVFDSLDTFAFVPGHTTHSGAHIRDGIDMKRTMMMVIIALIPCLLFGTWNIGHQYLLGMGAVSSGDPLMSMFWEKFGWGATRILPLLVVSYGVGLGIEFLFAGLRKHSINEGFLVSGMLIPLIVPADISLWMVGLATAFAVVIGKEVFGGTGMNIVNVALTARAFLFFAYPTKISGNVWLMANEGDTFADGYTGATAMGELANTIGQPVGGNGTASIRAMFSDSGAYSLWNQFVGLEPGSIGETSALACLIGAAILLFVGIASWRVMASFFVGGFVMAFIFNSFPANDFMAIPPIHQLMMGGFFFGMVFMATDPVTAAQTNTGKFIYGFFAGFFSIMIRVFNPAYPEGVMMAILFMNVMAPMIDHYVIQANIKKRLKRAAVAA